MCFVCPRCAQQCLRGLSHWLHGHLSIAKVKKDHVYFQGKKCTVVGGCGFLGRHIVEKLLEKGYSVNVFDIRSTFEDERVTFYVGDLCRREVCTYCRDPPPN